MMYYYQHYHYHYHCYYLYYFYHYHYHCNGNGNGRSSTDNSNGNGNGSADSSTSSPGSNNNVMSDSDIKTLNVNVISMIRRISSPLVKPHSSTIIDNISATSATSLSLPIKPLSSEDALEKDKLLLEEHKETPTAVKSAVKVIDSSFVARLPSPLILPALE